MKKLAKFNPWLLVPGAGLVNPDLADSSGLPEIFKKNNPTLEEAKELQQYNNAAWHTVFSTATLSALIIGLRLAANASAKRDLEKARARAHENKINAMYAYSTPNTAPQAEAVKKVRSLGVSKDASGWGEIAVRTVPIALSVPAALMASKIVDDMQINEDREEADQKLAEARNKLDALQAKLLKLRLKKSASALSDIPAPESEEESETSADEEEEKRKNKEKNKEEAKKVEREIVALEARVPEDLKKEASIGETIASIGRALASHWILATALTAGMSGAVMYTITKDKDEERKRKKLLEKQIYAQNFTNNPPRIELLLGKHQAFPDDESRQNYIKEISKAVK